MFWPFIRYYSLLGYLSAAFGLMPGITAPLGAITSLPASTAKIDAPAPSDANLQIFLDAVALEDDIYLDSSPDYNLYGDPSQYEAPGFQTGIHYLDTHTFTNQAEIDNFQASLNNIGVEVFVWGDNIPTGPLGPGQYPDELSGKVAFVFKNGTSEPDNFHIKDIFFDDPTLSGNAANPVFSQPFLSNMQVWTPRTNANLNQYTLMPASMPAVGDGNYSNGSNFPFWDPFNEGLTGSGRIFNADFSAQGSKVAAGKELALIFDYDNPSGSLGVFAHKVNAVRFGMHVGGMNNDESMKVWVEMPIFATPEPGSWVLLGTGMVGLLGYAWRCKRSG